MCHKELRTEAEYVAASMPRNAACACSAQILAGSATARKSARPMKERRVKAQHCAPRYTDICEQPPKM
eukprot:1463121-Pleurochrysis_carterae.AAC.1